MKLEADGNPGSRKPGAGGETSLCPPGRRRRGAPIRSLITVVGGRALLFAWAVAETRYQ